MSSVLAVTQPYGVGLGQQLPLNFANPAAGANYTRTHDGYALRRYLTLVFTLTTDANPANRYVTVEVQGKDGLAYVVDAAAVTVSANSTQRFVCSIFRGVAEWATNTDVLLPLAPVLQSPGDTFTIVVANVQAGDTLTKIRGSEERFPLNADVLPNLAS